MDAGYFLKKLSNGAKFNLKVKRKPSIDKIKVVSSGDSLTLKNSVIETVKPNRKKLKAKSLQHQANLKQEQLNEFRKKNRIYVWGSDIPDPVSNFEDLHTLYGISKTLSNNAKEMGYEFLTPVQMQAIPVMLESRELLACAPTGSGKTAAFLLPILHSLKERKRTGIRAVIVAPTRELAKQIQRECQKLSEGTGVSSFVIKKANANKPISKKQDILVTTPNRLVFLLNQEPPIVSLSTVKWLIIDESDKLFETGKQGFRDQLAVIYKSCSGPAVRRAMFSATFASEVEAWCKLNMDNVVTISVGARNSAVNIIKQNLIFVGSEAGKLVAFRDLIKKGIRPPVLVFVQSKDRAKELFGELIYDGINVDVIHAERTQTQRDNVVKSFRAGKIWVLICTELMGRGIDFRGVNLVVNYDFPPSAVSYIHRIGRTGRAGRPGEAVTFFTEDDVSNLRTIAQIMKDSGCEVPEYMMDLKKPSRKDKKHLAKQAPKRKSISTIPKDKYKRKRPTNEPKLIKGPIKSL